MKYLFALLAVLSFTAAFSQEPVIDLYQQKPKAYPAYNGDSSEVFSYVEVEPEFPGGRGALKSFIDSAVIYPQQAEESGIQGKCYVKFIVEKNGQLSNFEVVRGVSDCRECDKEAIRVLRSTPKWSPGKNSGKAVRSSYTYPVVFKTPVAEPMVKDPVEHIDIVEEAPQFPGGMSELKRFLADNIRYPQRAWEEGLSGKCYVEFVVTEDGTITDLVVKRSVPNCPECDAEAIRVIKLMPKWIPGKVGGKVTKMKYNLPVEFKFG